MTASIISIISIILSVIAVLSQIYTVALRKFNLEIFTCSNAKIEGIDKDTKNHLHKGEWEATDDDKLAVYFKKWLRIVNKSEAPITILSLHIGKISACSNEYFPIVIEPYGVNEGYFTFTYTGEPTKQFPKEGRNRLTVVTTRKTKDYRIEIAYQNTLSNE